MSIVVILPGLAGYLNSPARNNQRGREEVEISYCPDDLNI